MKNKPRKQMRACRFFFLCIVLILALLAGCGGKVSGSTVDPAVPKTTDNSDVRGLQLLKCLEAGGAKMYGSYTCGHCRNQKKLLGPLAEAEFVRVYVECSPHGENPQAMECMQKGIQAYPTWIFKDGEVNKGYKEISELQELSGCTDEIIKNY